MPARPRVDYCSVLVAKALVLKHLRYPSRAGLSPFEVVLLRSTYHVWGVTTKYFARVSSMRSPLSLSFGFSYNSLPTNVHIEVGEPLVHAAATTHGEIGNANLNNRGCNSVAIINY